MRFRRAFILEMRMPKMMGNLLPASKLPQLSGEVQECFMFCSCVVSMLSLLYALRKLDFNLGFACLGPDKRGDD